MCTTDPPASLADATGGLAGGAVPLRDEEEEEQEDHHHQPLPGPPRALLACQFGRWWPRYREHALSPAVVIDLTDEEVDFLLQDGVALGDGDAARALARAPSEDDGDASSSSSSSSSSSEVADWTSRLPRLAAAIADALASPELAASPAVVPKLNWSTPWDAAWVLPPAGLLLPAPEAPESSGGENPTTTVSLSDLVGGGGSVVVCGNAEQVVLLLQSSDRAAHDLSLVARLRGGGGGSEGDDTATTIKPQLALRSWRPLRPERELRLFVAGHRVVGVSQRDATQRYEQLRAPAAARRTTGGGGGGGGERAIDALARRACAFHARHVRDTFEVPDYAMDVYVLPDDDGAVLIVDVNPVAATTSPACFGSWRAVPGGLWRSPEYRSYLAEGDEQEVDEEEDEEDEEEEDEGEQHQQLPPLRFVGDGLGAAGADGVGVGQRFACGMPFDVLNMSEWAGGAAAENGAPAGAADVIVEAMRRAAARDDDAGGGAPT
jgi:hypothetical protein